MSLNPVTIFTNYINNEVNYYHRIYHFNMVYKRTFRSYNNEADAFKHTFMQAFLALKYGEYISKKIGDDHENKPNNDPNEMNMDLWNNRQGREIALEIKRQYPKYKSFPQRKINDIVAAKIMKRMRANQLITDPFNPKGKYYKDESIGETQNSEAKLLIQQYLKMYKDNQKQQLKDYIENILKQKYLNQVPTQQNLKTQIRNPLNMNFAELIKQPQMATVKNERFNTPIAALKDPSLNLNYGKNTTKYNTMKNQTEKNATLYKGSVVKSQPLSAKSGKSILNSTTNTPIPQVQYSNLPEFKPLNVKLENVPVYNPNPVFYSAPNYNNNSSSGFGIDIGQLLEVGEALFDLWQSNNKRKQIQSNKNQQQNNQNQPVEQGYEFIHG